MDPQIQPFTVLAESEDEITVRTGFGAVPRKKFNQAMPGFLHFETDTIEKLEALRFDDPWDERRWLNNRILILFVR